MSISALKKNRAAILEKLKQSSQEQAKGARSYDDPRMWKPTLDKERGTGSATIRFLPAKDQNDQPWVNVNSYSFKGPTGKWYIENSLRTIGVDGKPINDTDPVADLCNRLWNSGIESDKKVGPRRRQRYYSWVLVIKDPANPENEGKVKLFEYGPFFFNMIQDAMFPKFEDDKPVNPFCPWDGANLSIRMVAKQLNGNTVPDYDKSCFTEPSEMGTDEFIEEIYDQVQDLKEFLDPKNFKSPEELKRRLVEVMGPTCGSGVETVVGWGSQPTQERPSVERVVEDDVPFDNSKPIKQESESDDGDELEFLKSLVADL